MRSRYVVRPELSNTDTLASFLEGIDAETASSRPAFAAWLVASAIGLLIAALALTAGQYGYHRDELYFRLLPAAWGYTDQPPLTPFLARTFSRLIADEPWALRIPAIIAAALSVGIVALIAREAGGARRAQGIAAYGYAFGSMTLTMGHVLLTASLDLIVWPGIILCVMRATGRNQPRWLLGAGALVGISMYNKLLVAMLLASVAVGLLFAGPRNVLRSKWAVGAIAVALIIGCPNILYQAMNGWPQLEMGSALAAKNGAEVRGGMWLFLLLMLGPPLVPIWIAGLVGLVRRAEWRPYRFLLVAFPVLLGIVWLAGTQTYYPYGMLVVLYAMGSVIAAEFSLKSAWHRVLVFGALATNAVVCILISLPVLPIGVLGSTPVPSINQVAADQVGWPAYVEQIEHVIDTAPISPDTVILTSNYGEAGALARYGSGNLPIYSAQNALFDLGPPPLSASDVVAVGASVTRVQPFFARCDVVATLDNGVGVKNEEQGRPIAICHDRLRSWSEIWPKLRHLD